METCFANITSANHDDVVLSEPVVEFVCVYGHDNVSTPFLFIFSGDLTALLAPKFLPSP